MSTAALGFTCAFDFAERCIIILGQYLNGPVGALFGAGRSTI